MELLNAGLIGAIVVSAWAIAVFFVRFWRKTRERLFAYFAAAFVLLAVERVSSVLVSSEHQVVIYLLRLCAFGVLIFGIVDNNRRGGVQR